jgi:hypothetical protein
VYSILCVRNFFPPAAVPTPLLPPRDGRMRSHRGIGMARSLSVRSAFYCIRFPFVRTAEKESHAHQLENTTPEVEQVPALSVTAAQLSTQPCSDPPPSTALHTTHRALCPRYRSRLRVRPRAWPCAGMRSSSSSLAATFCVSGIGCSFACSALNHSSSLFLEDGVIAPVCCLQALTVARGKSIR